MASFVIMSRLRFGLWNNRGSSPGRPRNISVLNMGRIVSGDTQEAAGAVSLGV